MQKPIETFAERFNKAILLKDIKPVDLSEITGISKSTISHYMSGYTKPKSDKLFVLAKALDVSEPWLMGLDVPMERATIPQSEESPVMKAILNSPEYNNSDILIDYMIKKRIDKFNFESTDFDILIEFEKLNPAGKREAINRMRELTFVPKFTEHDNEIMMVAEDHCQYDSKQLKNKQKLS